MIVQNACDWIIERLERRTPFFATRINDGEMCQMYRTKPEGALLGTDANPAYCHRELGEALSRMLDEMGQTDMENELLDQILIGCSWNTDRADELGQTRFKDDVRGYNLLTANWCHEHWPLEGVVDGNTIRLLEVISRTAPAMLVTCRGLMDARWCMKANGWEVPAEDSWSYRDKVLSSSLGPVYAKAGFTFVWCAGGGLKPTAWRLWREFPQSSHIDLGHLFNGAFGMTDYGWLQRQDGPWYQPYFKQGGLKDWVRGFLP